MTTEQVSLSRFILDRGLRMYVKPADHNPNMDSDTPMDHWRCIIRTPSSKGRSLTVYFSMGVGHHGKEPELADVLDTLASDSSSVENADGFEKWCAEFGYDADSRKGERTFKACERQAAKLKAFLGDADYDLLLWHTERL